MGTPFIPQVLIHTDFETASTATQQPLNACIVGPHAQLVRHAAADEKALGAAGTYAPDSDTVHPWPSLAAGAIVDLDSAAVFVDDAELVFFHLPTGGDSEAFPTASQTNRISVTGDDGFAANGPAYPRLSGLYGRDVRLGDRVRVVGVVAGDAIEHDSYVIGLDGDPTVAVLGSVSADPANLGNHSVSGTAVQTAGTSNCFSLGVDSSTFLSYTDGIASDVYTVAVTQASTGGDPSTAVVRVRSASGLDDVDNVVPAAADSYRTVGRRGFKFKFVVTDGPCDLVVGQTWQATMTQAYTQLAPTVAGTYTGTVDDTYIVEVTRGGSLTAGTDAGKPQITVSTIRGLDNSGPTTIGSSPVNHPIGTLGATVNFGAATMLALGEKFYVPVTASKTGVVNQLILASPMPTDLLTAAALDLTLYARKNVQIPYGRTGHAPIVNYTVADSGVTVAAAITLRDPAFVDADGSQIDLTLSGGDLYIEYRAWLPDLEAAIGSATDLASLNVAIPGAIDPANPLKYAVAKALVGAGGTPVQFVSVPDPTSVDDWSRAFGLLAGINDVYNVVPLTHDAAVLTLLQAQIASSTSDDVAVPQAMVVGLKPRVQTAIAVASTVDPTLPILAKIGDDPNAIGTQYTLVTAPLDDAGFIDRGVRVGDQVRYGYSTSFGTTTWTTGSVARVISSASLLLRTAAPAPVTVASRIEIWRTLSPSEIVADLSTQAANFSDSRVAAVWSDLYDFESPAVESYHLAAAVAGLISGSPPHAGLTNVALDGFADSVTDRGSLTEGQRKILCGNGVWLVSRTPNVLSNGVVTRLATTTDPTTLATREEVVRRNVDSMTRYMRAELSSYLGTINVTDSAASLLRVQIAAAHKYLIGSGYTDRLGGQLIAASLTTISQDPVFHDRFDIAVAWTVPTPCNTLQLNLTITV